MTLAVPLHVAVPLPKVAVVGAVVAPKPEFMIVNWVPLGIVFVPIKATVAVAPVTPLKFVRVQVWPPEPLIVPPEVYVGLVVSAEYVGFIPCEPPRLKFERLQVWPAEPVIVPPEV
jgi:hypothetical protein